MLLFYMAFGNFLYPMKHKVSNKCKINWNMACLTGPDNSNYTLQMEHLKEIGDAYNE